MTDDVVAELDARIRDAEQSTDYAIEWRRPLLVGFLRRARDEIVALRNTVERQRLVLSAGHAEVRAEALEEAAMVADRWEERPEFDRAAAIAAAIRALKDQPKCP